MRTDYLIQSVSEVKQNSNWASWDFSSLSYSDGVFSEFLFLCYRNTAEGFATPVFPKMLKIGHTDVLCLSDLVVALLTQCLCVSV